MDLKSGDVLHCTSRGLLADAIQSFTKSRVNHTALVLELYGDMYVIDSQRDGTNLRPLDDWFDKFEYTYRVSTPIGYDMNEIRRRALSKSGITKYDFAALLWHQPVYILTGKWKGRRHTADRKMFCSEYIGWIFDIKDWHKLSPQALCKALHRNDKFI